MSEESKGSLPSQYMKQPREALKLRGFGFFNPSKKLIKLTFLDEKGEFQRESYLVFVQELDSLRNGTLNTKGGKERKSFTIYEDVPPWKR